MTIFFFAKMRDVVLLFLFSEMKEKIDEETDGDATDDFNSENFQNTNGRDLLGDHDGKHFIGCGNKNRDERADGNDAACI